MDVFFETSTGKFFSLEIGFFVTIRDIKDKVHKHHGFPISAQTLVFQGQAMADDNRDVNHQLLHNSSSTSSSLPPRTAPASSSSSTCPARSSSLRSRRRRPSRFALVHGGVELAEERALGECEVGDGLRVSVAATKES
ncbi:ubiquitin-like protein-NEDD8-like protein RUB3 [Canna indica]|uniref:Ubiquitin-like protein-NEDD8-like protein RUB3 n=1 Tax=Canna indica TaxID=4628 RepID=A0AAQ3KLF8_9LILI|nr:ubiquitin-like protein-NEDD8-like protein RUB3 [Canna indica]